MLPIYLDYAATSPIDKRVAAKMQQCLIEDHLFGNPASQHYYGKQALQLIEEARNNIALAIHATPSELIFTSGATESNNLALKGVAYLYQRKGKHIITMKTEHKAVLDVCQQLAKEGFSFTYLNPQPTGLLDIQELKEAIRPDTILISIMHVNNETGVVQNIHAISEVTALQGILLHVDAAQSIGKLTINVQQSPIDLISLSAHKIYGPKGIGALYLRKKPRVRVSPLIQGGGHEQGMRSGTLATHQIVGMGEACRLLQLKENERENRCIHDLSLALQQGLQTIAVAKMNCDHSDKVPHILNLRFEGMIAQAILEQLPSLAASTASACVGKGMAGSYVLRAMGFNDAEVKSSLRLSLGRFTTEHEIKQVIAMFQQLFNGT